MLRAVIVKRCIRPFHRSSITHAASIFKMPAMSPTMSEGGIVAWKIKEGDSFNAGDPILEVETDKATIDVEAADDGKLWQILVNEGATEVPVGKPIAFLAEVDDDLGSLKAPEVDQESKKEEKNEQQEEKPKIESKNESKPEQKSSPNKKLPSKQQSNSSILQKANPNQKLSPAVELLLHENNISQQDAISKIQASGPNGRILKGDVLAYLGNIETSSIIKLTEFLKSREHLDLSNIVKEEVKPKQEKKTEKRRIKPENILNFELSSTLDEGVTIDQFKHTFDNSVKSAIQHTYAFKYPQYATSPNASSIYDKYDVFEDIISPPVTKERFEVYDVDIKLQNQSHPSSSDFEDILGITPLQPTIQPQVSPQVNIQFKVKYDIRLPDSKQYVQLFENSLLSQVSTSTLKITN